jgi:hypothetical protein
MKNIDFFDENFVIFWVKITVSLGHFLPPNAKYFFLGEKKFSKNFRRKNEKCARAAEKGHFWPFGLSRAARAAVQLFLVISGL